MGGWKGFTEWTLRIGGAAAGILLPGPGWVGALYGLGLYDTAKGLAIGLYPPLAERPDTLSRVTPNAPAPIVLGKVRVGTNIVRFETEPSQGNRLNIAASLCDGLGNGIGGILKTATYKPHIWLNETFLGSADLDANNWPKMNKAGVLWHMFDGTTTQALSDISATDNFRAYFWDKATDDQPPFLGTAWIALRLDPEKHDASSVIPDISAEIQGLKFTPIDEGAVEYSNNPAALLYGILRDVEGHAAAIIDAATSFTAFETYCNVDVDAGAGTSPRYHFNAVYAQPGTVNDIKKDIMAASNCRIIRDADKFKIVYEHAQDYTPAGAGTVTGAFAGSPKLNFYDTGLGSANDYYNLMAIQWLTGDNAGQIQVISDYVASSGLVTCRDSAVSNIDVADTYQIVGAYGFNLDNIVAGSFRWEEREQPNVIRLHFLDGADSYTRQTIDLRNEVDIEDNGEIVYEEDAWYITDKNTAAYRAQQLFYKYTYAKYVCTFQAFPTALRVEPYDVVTITHPLPGWTDKKFIVLDTEQDQDGTCTFSCYEYYGAVFGDTLAPYDLGTTNTPSNPSQVDPVTTIALAAATKRVAQSGVLIPEFTITYTKPTNLTFWSHVEVYLSEDDSTYYLAGTDSSGTWKGGLDIFEAGDTVYCKVISVNVNGTKEALPAAADDSIVVPAAALAIAQNTTIETGGAITMNTGGNVKGGQTAYDTGVGFFLGYDTSAYKFSIGNSGGQKLLWDGTNLSMTGAITAATGTIGGWEIGATTLTSANDAIILDSANEVITVGNDGTEHLDIGGTASSIYYRHYYDATVVIDLSITNQTFTAYPYLELTQIVRGDPVTTNFKLRVGTDSAAGVWPYGGYGPGVRSIDYDLYLTAHQSTGATVYNIILNPSSYIVQYSQTTGYLGVSGDTDLLYLSANLLTVSGSVKIADSGNIGCASDTDLLTLSSGLLTVAGSLKLADGASIGEVSDTDLMVMGSGTLTVNGSVKVDTDAYIGCDADTDLLQIKSGELIVLGNLRCQTGTDVLQVGSVDAGNYNVKIIAATTTHAYLGFFNGTDLDAYFYYQGTNNTKLQLVMATPVTTFDVQGILNADSIISEAAISISAGQRFNLEGSTGDTYMTFNSAGAQIEFYVNNTLAGHIDLATGFVND